MQPNPRLVRPNTGCLATAAALSLCATVAACRQGGEPHHEHALELPPVGPSIAVRLDGRAIDVPIASVASDGGGLALASLWRAAWPNEDPLHLSFDLVGSDGFRPMSRPKCTRLLTGAEFVRGHLDAVTHDVSYDDELKLPGCYRVHHVVGIEASR
jgi:hypothetical protein